MATTETRRWIRRLAAAGAALVLVGGITALMLRAARPHWRIYTLPFDPRIGAAVAIDYPDDWTLDPRKMEPTSFPPSVSFRPAKPNTFAQWCQEHLFGKKPVNS